MFSGAYHNFITLYHSTAKRHHLGSLSVAEGPKFAILAFGALRVMDTKKSLVRISFKIVSS